MNRPSAFRWWDFATFGGAALLMTAAAIWVSFKADPGTSSEAYLLVWVVAAAGWFVYGMLVRARAAFIARFPIMTKHGIMVDVGGYAVTLKDIEDEIQRICDLYAPNIPDPERFLRADSKRGGRVWCRFQPSPIEHPRKRKATVAGFITLGGERMVVGYDDPEQDLESTAFGHELGHIILGRFLEDWSETEHHKAMKELRVP